MINHATYRLKLSRPWTSSALIADSIAGCCFRAAMKASVLSHSRSASDDLPFLRRVSSSRNELNFSWLLTLWKPLSKRQLCNNSLGSIQPSWRQPYRRSEPPWLYDVKWIPLGLPKHRLATPIQLERRPLLCRPQWHSGTFRVSLPNDDGIEFLKDFITYFCRILEVL